ncbi:hypothetical protein SC499_26360, partial [Peribacillus simplex]|uniref:hypothetical protein n=1 Tax=Peribacillus simplex TaxID=1478 RepID=UPI00298E3EC2
MKNKLLKALIVLIAVLGTILGENLYKSSKQSAEMEQYRIYMNKKYIPLVNKTNTFLDDAQNAQFVNSWYDLGFFDNIELIGKWEEIEKDLLNMDAKYENSIALKKNLINSTLTYQDSLGSIDLYAPEK